MSGVFAKAGEPVTDEDGNVICYLAKDLVRYQPVRLDSFTGWVETAPKEGDLIDRRFFKSEGKICINGEWRP